MHHVSVVLIHGVGTQAMNYADNARAWLAKDLGARGFYSTVDVVCWAPIMDAFESDIMKDAIRAGASKTALRELAVNVLADAAAYRPGTDVAYRIVSLVSNVLDVADKRGHPIVVIAHSLGVLIALDAFRSAQRRHLRFFGSMGANLPLFLVKPLSIPVLHDVRWVNYFDAEDFLGYPLKPLNSGVEDRVVNVGSLLTWWNGFSHMEYWDDRKLWKAVIRDIAATISH